MKKIFGLFNSASDTQRAVNSLTASLVPETQLQIVSRHPASLGQLTHRPRLAPTLQLGRHNVRLVESNQPASRQLRDLGLPTHSLPSFSNYVREGSVVLVVDADDDSAESIASIIRDVNGTLP